METCNLLFVSYYLVILVCIDFFSLIVIIVALLIGEIMCVLFATLLGLPKTFSPLHLLWVNLVTDGPPATALGYNPSDPLSMTRKPRRKGEPLMSSWLMIRYLIVGAYVASATLFAFWWWYQDKGVSITQLRNWQDCSKWINFAHSAEAPYWPNQPCDIFTSARHSVVPQTMALTVLVTIELLKALSAVSLDNSLLRVWPWKNKVLIPSVVVPYGLHLMVMYSPFLSKLMGITPLSHREWKVRYHCIVSTYVHKLYCLIGGTSLFCSYFIAGRSIKDDW